MREEGRKALGPALSRLKTRSHRCHVTAVDSDIHFFNGAEVVAVAHFSALA